MSDETAPATLNVSECPICHRNALDGLCGHCGFDQPDPEAQAPAQTAKPEPEG